VLGFDAPASAAVLLASLLTGPGSSHAPQVRIPHPGAPGRVGAGTNDIAFAVTDGNGARSVGRGLSDQLALEVGLESDFTEVVIGFAGVRFTPLPPSRRRIAFVLDVEGGAGVGFEARRPAGGGYYGLGLGYRIHFFTPYLRARQQLTGARDVPMTAYTTVVVGMQFAILDTLHFWGGTGFRYVTTSEGGSNLEIPRGGWLTYDIGLSLTFGGWRQREALERHEQRRARPNPSGGS
jgi:hypothetical protein